MTKRSSKRSNALSTLAAGTGALVASALAAAGGWILYSNLRINRELPVPKAIDADRETFTSPTAGEISYYADRQAAGRPVVLLHSINAAASAIEMSSLFGHFRGRRPVYALDLPGYGFSERSDRRYSPELYEAAILDFIKSQLDQPADVIALSLSSEFAARAAMLQPGLFHSLVLISPTGLSQPQNKPASQKSADTRSAGKVYPALSFELWERPLFDLIATRRSIDYFLSQSFAGPVPPELVDYAYITSHQPGAQHAPLHFLSGLLFTPSIREQAYEQLLTPTLALYDLDPFTGFDRLPELLRTNPRWKAVRITPTRGLPHWDKFTETVDVIDDFYRTL